MNNKTLGNSFETELCEKLSNYGFWVHLLNANKSGQPADIMAVRNGKAHLIDAKVCTNGRFVLSRVEENQELAMSLWNECGNGIGWFAMKADDQIYMVCFYVIQVYKDKKHSLSKQDIQELGIPLEKWVTKCK